MIQENKFVELHEAVMQLRNRDKNSSRQREEEKSVAEPWWIFNLTFELLHDVSPLLRVCECVCGLAIILTLWIVYNNHFIIMTW